MRLTRGITLLALCWLLPACERKPDLARSKVHHDSGLEFQYPGNWKVEGSLVSPGLCYLEIRSTGQSLAIIRTPLQGEDLDLRSFAASFSSMIDEAAGTPILKETRTSDGEPALESHHVLETMGTTIECTRIFRKKTTGTKTFYILNQATDHAFPKVSPGFDLIAKSLSYQQP